MDPRGDCEGILPESHPRRSHGDHKSRVSASEYNELADIEKKPAFNACRIQSEQCVRTDAYPVMWRRVGDATARYLDPPRVCASHRPSTDAGATRAPTDAAEVGTAQARFDAQRTAISDARRLLHRRSYRVWVSQTLTICR
jgi:hypothetical protein